MRTSDTAVAIVVAGSLALAGCGGDGDGEADGSGAAVTVVDFAFDPATVEVEAGSTVTWTNDDGVGHTVTAGAPGAPTGAFDLAVAGGSSIEISLDEAGTVPYFCSIHPAMTGVVEVS